LTLRAAAPARRSPALLQARRVAGEQHGMDMGEFLALAPSAAQENRLASMVAQKTYSAIYLGAEKGVQCR